MTKWFVSVLRVTSYWVAISLAMLAWLDIYVRETFTGIYYSTIHTNLSGEHYYELAVLTIFIPIALYFLLKDATETGKVIRRALKENAGDVNGRK